MSSEPDAVPKSPPELSAYAGESVLLIGGAGFIGSHVAEVLGRLGAGVVVLDNLSSGSRENLAAAQCTLIPQSIEGCDLAEVMRQHSIDRVFNFACGSLVDSLEAVERDFQANLANSFKCLEAFRMYGQGRAFVYCSTGSVYGEPDAPEYEETSPLRPSTPYGTSKACADLYAQLYASFFAAPIRIVRYNNIYGPRKKGTAIPVFIERALKREPIVIEGGSQVRTPTFVLDAAEATILVGVAEGIDGEAFNVSSEESFSIDEMATLIWHVVNPGTDPVFERRGYRPGEIMDLRPSVAKIRRWLGWQSRHCFRDGLELLIEHLRR